MMEPMSSSVCRNAKPKTARSISAGVIAAGVIAKAESSGIPPARRA